MDDLSMIRVRAIELGVINIYCERCLSWDRDADALAIPELIDLAQRHVREAHPAPLAQLADAVRTAGAARPSGPTS